MKKTSLAVLLLATAFVAAAQDKACSPADEKKAEQAVDRVVNWDLFYKAWQDYRQCDKGAVDDNFTDALMRLLVDWKHIDVFAKQMEGNKEYRDFVHKHINSPAAKGDVDAVYSRAKMSCPKGLDSTCKDIATAAKPFAGMEIPTSAPLPAMAPTPGAAPPKK
jgi:hypothetical protein